MEATRPTVTGTCPSWCVIDHSAPLIPGRPKAGTLKTHIGPDLEISGTRVHGSCYPGHEPEIAVYNYLAGIRLHISAGQAGLFLQLFRWLARENAPAVRQFAAAVEQALATVGETPGDDAAEGTPR